MTDLIKGLLEEKEKLQEKENETFTWYWDEINKYVEEIKAHFGEKSVIIEYPTLCIESEEGEMHHLTAEIIVRKNNRLKSDFFMFEKVPRPFKSHSGVLGAFEVGETKEEVERYTREALKGLLKRLI